MTNYPTSNMVINHQSIFLPLTFGLNWVSDSEMRALMKNFYLTQDMAFPNEEMMVAQMQNKADLIADFWNKIGELAKIKYEPIENYDRYEDSLDNDSTSGSSSSSSESNAFEYPMEAPLKKQVASSDGNGSASSSAKSDRKHTAHIHGNIGVTTSQQMLESEIELRRQLSRLKELYIKEYNEFFMLVL